MQRRTFLAASAAAAFAMPAFSQTDPRIAAVETGLIRQRGFPYDKPVVAMTTTPEMLARVAGTYRGPRGNDYKFVVEGDKLMLTLPGGAQGYQVFAQTPSKFFYLLADGTMEFDEASPATAMTYRGGGLTLPCKRVG